MQFDENGDLIVPDDYKLTITVSYDEKPGIQAISNTAQDLRPTSNSAASKPYIQKFLKEQDMKPFKIKYYCEKRDPDFESKMHEVLLVYKQIEMQFDENGDLIVPDDYKGFHILFLKKFLDIRFGNG